MTDSIIERAVQAILAGRGRDAIRLLHSCTECGEQLHRSDLLAMQFVCHNCSSGSNATAGGAADEEACGCDKRGDRTFLCTYHQGVEDERADIIEWLLEIGYGSALEYAERIEKGEHHK